jgi:hypothetical protein
MKTIPSTPHHQGVPSRQHLKILESIWFMNFTSGAIIFHTQNYLLRSNVQPFKKTTNFLVEMNPTTHVAPKS